MAIAVYDSFCRRRTDPLMCDDRGRFRRPSLQRVELAMTVSRSAKREYILLTSSQADEVRGETTPRHRLEPRELSDGNFILGVQVLDDPAHAKHIPLLATLPRCQVVVSSNGEVAIVPESLSEPPPEQHEPITTKSGQPWDVPKLPQKGDWNAERLYASIGRALSEWEELERGIASLFQSLLSPTLYALPAQRAYGSIVTFRSRAEMVRAAGEAYFAGHPVAVSADSTDSRFDSAAAKREFERIMKVALSLSNRRNEITHGIVGEYSTPNGPTKGVALHPPDFTNKGRPLAIDDLRAGRLRTPRPAYAYTSKEIEYYTLQFQTLRREVHRLADSIHRHFVFEDKDAG